MTPEQTTMLRDLLAAGVPVADAIHHVNSASLPTANAVVLPPALRIKSTSKSKRPSTSKSTVATVAAPTTPKTYTVAITRATLQADPTAEVYSLSGLGRPVVKGRAFFERLAAFDPTSKLSTLIKAALKS